MSNDAVALGSILAHHARTSPSRAALILDDRSISYSELDARTNRRARLFAARGVGEGDFVTVALPNGLDFYETIFAIWKLGAIPNVVAAKLATPEMEAILELVRPRLFVGDPPRSGMPAIAGESPGLPDIPRSRCQRKCRRTGRR